MKKLFYYAFLSFLLAFILTCSQSNESLSPTQRSISVSEQSLYESSNNLTACTEAADQAILLAHDYQKAVKDLIKADKENNSGELAIALDQASTTFIALQVVHSEMLTGCGQQQGIDPDQYEPNNNWPEAFFLGALHVGTPLNIQGNFHDLGFDLYDWFRVFVIDPYTPTVQENFKLYITLSSIPQSSNYDLFLNSFEIPEILLASSENFGNSDETIEYIWPGQGENVDDSQNFYIEVRHISGPATADLYDLTINFSEL
jgi:hypothetical protein